MSSVLDEVLEKINILDVVSQYVKLRRTGRNFVGLCPFHKEKTPSFTVSLEKQIYYCFGCHEGGNAVHFVMRYEHSTFQEALESLAARYGIEIRSRQSSRKTPVVETLGRLADYYHQNLLRSRSAQQYLAARGIDGKTAEEFRLGYAEKAVFTRDMSQRLRIPLDILLSIGVAKEKDGEVRDVFRGRVTIPIIDVNGKVIGFGGRAMGKDVIPKYLNSPESAVFSKRSVLYGIDRARKHIGDRDEALVVEGYFDLISLNQAGIGNVVSTLGTSVTEEQVQRLRNYTENITLMLDGDEAGVKSAMRLIGLFGEMGINGRILVLPPEHDPDSFIRAEGAAGFERLFATRQPLLDCFFDLHRKNHDMKTLEGRLGFVKTVLPHVATITDTVKKRLYTRRLAELTGVDEYLFMDHANEREMRVGNTVQETDNSIEKRVIGILLNRPVLLEHFKGKEVSRYINDPGFQAVLSGMLSYSENAGHVDVKHFVNILEGEGMRDSVLRSALETSEQDAEEMELVVRDFLSYRERKAVMREAREITDSLAEAEKTGDEKAIIELLERKRQMLTFMKSKSVK